MTWASAAGSRRVSDLCVVGGAGHIGLPLALAFAGAGRRVLLYDTDEEALRVIQRGRVPFMEQGAEAALTAALSQQRLTFSTQASAARGIPAFIVAIGTPVDEYFNPKYGELLRALEPLLPHLTGTPLLVLRSTVYPGTTAWLARQLQGLGRRADVAFCPERVVEGRVLQELRSLPQIVSGVTSAAEARAARLFEAIAPEVVRLKPMEAEFAKLFCNAYRYIQFATTNQFYMMANSAGLDYYRILEGMQQNYARMRDLPRAGFSAGPCLLKDTMQLTAFYDNEFSLGYTAMLVNEGLPLYVVQRLAQAYNLSRLTVGLLGMAFKADVDDPRASLSYKLKKVLQMRARRVLTTDPYVRDPEVRPLGEVITRSDLLILCVPHRAYRDLDVRGKPVVDIWNFFGRGGIVPGPRPRRPRASRARPARAAASRAA
jgi:UDP-N-acetyl-D-mannosaminuronic acid dehydrogenase